MVQTTDTTPAAPVCDRDANCGLTAVQAYTWEWGESGVCCALHGQLANQIAEQINRKVVLVPLPRTGPEPITRDERVKLKAEVYAAEEELKDAKARGLELYRANEQLVRTNHLLTVRAREADAQLKDAQREATLLRGRLEEREAEAAELVVEIERLRTLERFVSPAPEPPPG